ncbi:hypothetical protein CSC42_6375 [Pseudomonas aeruginosa]|nr:hypothetical protein CSC42_6375 [Pseudomonas aeruginosa]
MSPRMASSFQGFRIGKLLWGPSLIVQPPVITVSDNVSNFF